MTKTNAIREANRGVFMMACLREQRVRNEDAGDATADRSVWT
jgi:hypothetical protein